MGDLVAALVAFSRHQLDITEEMLLLCKCEKAMQGCCSFEQYKISKSILLSGALIQVVIHE